MIALKTNKALFENDIRALVMAFFPGEKIVLGQIITFDYHIDCLIDEHKFSIAIDDGHKKTKKLTLETKAGEVISRNQVKRTTYDLLSEYTGKCLPWGTLTGIRPTKIAMVLLDKGYEEERIYNYFKSEYYISDAKYNLCMQVAGAERKILEPFDLNNSYSLYIGIPFCPTICDYCSFSSYPLDVWKGKVEDYLAALFKEIDYISKQMAGKKLLTVYMGGGTPTSLTAEQMLRLLEKLGQSFPMDSAFEVTVEAGRPDSITRDKLEVIREYGIKRISINPQTMNLKTLDLIGRKHTALQTVNAFKLAREVGFTNINMDIIVGLPSETAEDVRYTLAEIKKLDPESMTVHSLALKRAAVLNRPETKYKDSNEDVNAMIELTCEAAGAMQMKPYYLYRQKNIAGNLENIGYAKEGHEGIYNILIMEEKQTIIAIGAGATTKIVAPEKNGIKRIENVKSVKDYIERIDEMIMRKAELDID